LKVLLIIVLFILISCSHQDNWKNTWQQHHVRFKQVVELVKNDQLQKVYGRVGYAIPDSMGLDKVCGGIVFHETDFTYDGTYSILFRINFDSNKVGRRLYPVFIYTNNTKRIKEYALDSVTKIEDNWYLQYRG
jgi:hypothetical protein